MFEVIYNIVAGISKHEAVTVDENCTPKGLIVHANDIVPVCHTLYTHPKMYFDMLSCITGIDNGADAGTMEIAYNLYSIPNNVQLTIKVKLSRENPEIDTVSDIWKTADWHEREIYDMFGVRFRNHPDLRRILLPADWEGHPLRKDYKQQEYYRNIKVDY
jgi:NADH-quinone oxidoreductase subunit C